MKRLSLAVIVAASVISGCATVQSLIRSTIPYTSTLIIPSSSRTGTSLSATSSASGIDQIFGGQSSGTSQVKEIRVASASITASNPANLGLSVFSSVRLYLSRSDGSGEVLIASRSDVAANAGNTVVLDIDNSKFLDDLLKSANVRVRMEYVLRNTLSTDASVRASIGFSTTPVTK